MTATSNRVMFADIELIGIHRIVVGSAAKQGQTNTGAGAVSRHNLRSPKPSRS